VSHKNAKDLDRAVLKPESWPAADRDTWHASINEDDPFSEMEGRAHLRPISNLKVAKGYGRFLNFIARHQPHCWHLSAKERITPDLVKAYVEHLKSLGNSDLTLLARLQELHSMAAVLVPEGNFEFIRRMESRIRATAKPARNKRGLIVATDELLSLGLSLMEQASALSTPRQCAIQYRDGLIIAVLALRPWRRKNLTELILNKHLIRQGDLWLVLLGPEETKTHVHDDRTWPDILVPHLEEYLKTHRPLLMSLTGHWTAPIEDRLWVSSDGSPQTQISIYQQIRLHTAKAFGIAINPHRFRDAAATTMAIEDPKHVRISAQVLGHRSFQTTESYYQQADLNRAHADYTNYLLSIRANRTKK
jgi:integrase